MNIQNYSMNHTDILLISNIKYIHILDNNITYIILSFMLLIVVYLIIVFDEMNDTVKYKGIKW